MEIVRTRTRTGTIGGFVLLELYDCIAYCRLFGGQCMYYIVTYHHCDTRDQAFPSINGFSPSRVVLVVPIRHYIETINHPSCTVLPPTTGLPSICKPLTCEMAVSSAKPSVIGENPTSNASGRHETDDLTPLAYFPRLTRALARYRSLTGIRVEIRLRTPNTASAYSTLPHNVATAQPCC
jgi:hypothetical protein